MFTFQRFGIGILTVLMCTAIGFTNAAQNDAPETALEVFDTFADELLEKYNGTYQGNLENLVETFRNDLVDRCDVLIKCPKELAEISLKALTRVLGDVDFYPSPSIFATVDGGEESLFLGFSHMSLNGEKDRLISWIDLGSPAERADLRFGDRWIGFNKILFSHDKLSMREMLLNFSEIVNSGESVILQVVRGDKREHLSLKMIGTELIYKPDPRLSWLNSNSKHIAYIQFHEFSSTNQQTFHDLIQSIVNLKADGLILDLRGLINDGESVDRLLILGGLMPQVPSLKYVPKVAKDDTFVEVVTNGKYKSNWIDKKNENTVVVKNPAIFSAKVVLILDSRCSQGCGLFASIFSKAKRGVIIGESKIRVSVNISYPRSAHGSDMNIPYWRAQWEDGMPVDGSFQPEIIVPDATRKIFDSGVDNLLQKALEQFAH